MLLMKNVRKMGGLAALWCALLAGAEGARAQDMPLDDDGLPPIWSESMIGVPAVELSGELLFQILAADLAAQNGAWAAAINTTMEVARVTRDPRLARRALEFALGGDNLPRAWDASRLWVQLAPGDIQAQRTELMLAAANGETGRLGLAMREQLQQSDNPAEAIFQIQQSLLRLQDRAAALALLDDILRGQWLGYPEARAALAQAAYEAGEPARALAEARAALALKPDWEVAAGMVLQFGQDIEPHAVVSTARDFVRRHPEARDLRLALVSVLVQQGDFAGALAELDRMARANPEDFELLYLQGAIRYEAGDLDGARRGLRQYVEVESGRRRASGDGDDPTSSLADAQLLLARVLEDQGDPAQADAVLSTIEEPGVRFQARLRQAQLRSRLGQVEGALQAIDAADPGDEREHAMQVFSRVEVLEDAGRHEAAVQALEKGVAQLPEEGALRYALAMLYAQQGQIEAMERELRELVQRDPNNAHAWNALGYTLADRNERLDEAREFIDRAHRLYPDDAAILDSMGWVRFRQGDLPGAVHYLQRAWQADPQAEIGVHLGEVFWTMGDRDAARRIWGEVERQAPDDELLRSTRERLGVQ